MRYGLIGALILVLGVAEYAFVELAPLSPERRSAKLEQLPLLNRFIETPREKAAADYPKIKQKALSGSTWHKVSYYLMSSHFGGPADSTQARALLASDSTAVAQLYLSMWSRPQRIKPFSTEGMIIQARMIAEDLHRPGVSVEEHHRFASQDSARLALLLNAAQEGHPEAQNVVEILRSGHGVDIQHMLNNWNGGHFE